MQQRETLQGRVYKDILMRIYEGELPDGSSLPTLEELSRQYQVGDNCIRAVIGRLKENGYLSTKRGRPARIVHHPNQSEAEKRTSPIFSCDKKKLHSSYEAIRILFPSIYTYASLNCTEAQLEELGRIVPLLPTGEDACVDYVELNIRFFKVVLSSVQNNLILHIVQTVMQNAVLPAALVQKERARLEEEFLQGSDAMRSIYTAVLKNDSVCVKKQWKKLFQIAESLVEKVTLDIQDIPSKGNFEHAALQYASEFKYLLIAHDLYEGILEGKYPVGTFLPTISEARQVYGAAKITIQTAYRVLADLGIVRTIPGRGSKVTQLTFASTLVLDEEALSIRKHEYLEAIEFLSVVCGDIILYGRNLSFQALRVHLESELNPSHQYSALILCRYLMKETHSITLEAFYQAISGRLYWGCYFGGLSEGISAEEKHCLCMEILDALEQRQTDTAVARTQKLLAALSGNDQ